VDLLFVLSGVFFTVIYLLFTLFRTVRRKPDITVVDVALAFLVALVLLGGLVVSGLDGQTDSRVQISTFVIAGVLALFGVLFTLREVFHPQRLRQSRGILTLGISVLLVIAGFIVPLASAYFSLSEVNDRPSGENRQPANTTSTAGDIDAQATADASQEFFSVFNQVISIIASASGLTQDEVLNALDDGQTVAQLIEDNNGDLERVIDDITRLMQDFLRSLVAQDRVDPLRASAGIAGMEIVVRYAVNNDLSTLQRTGNEEADVTAEPTPGEGTPRESFFAFLTASFTPDSALETDALTTPGATPAVVTSTPFPTVTPPPTSRPTATRTPRPTVTATNTRERFTTRTPTPTPTLPSPCLARAEFNVNLRAEPDLEAALITTIPFETVVNVFGRNDDSTWWFVEYEGNGGWVSGEFVTVTSSCSRLPVRD
jgi:uncharacterized protein YgiM (DUF1202 family)